MNLCRLCISREANKKGSHIVPHFLLKRIENIDGKAERDYELGFAIGEFDTESWFGRSVSPETLEETFGELTDDEIRNNKHGLVVDFYFCSHCEDRLSKIESEYSKTLVNFELGKNYESGVSSALGLVFWASIFWRMSIHQQSGTYLSNEENETLRSFLDRFLLTDIGKIDEQLNSSIGDVRSMSYKLLRCPNFSDHNVTYLFWHPFFRKAYSLMIDEYFVILSPTNDYTEFEQKDFLQINDELNLSPKNIINGKELIKPITENKMNAAKLSIAKTASLKRYERMNEFWDDLHVKLGGIGTSMPSEIKAEIIRELNSEEKKMGRKHTREEINACTMRVLTKYGPSQASK
jgi:hypothetical protein